MTNNERGMEKGSLSAGSGGGGYETSKISSISQVDPGGP